jgi:hypothetical protein
MITFPYLARGMPDHLRDHKLRLRRKADGSDGVLPSLDELRSAEATTGVEKYDKANKSVATKYLWARARSLQQVRESYADFKHRYFWQSLNDEQSAFHLKSTADW